MLVCVFVCFFHLSITTSSCFHPWLHCIAFVCVFVRFAMFQAACYAIYEFVEEKKSLIEIPNMSSQMSSQMLTHFCACYLWIELNCENNLSVDVMSN